MEIKDVFALHDDRVSPEGTEVYSRLRSVKWKSEYRWRPNAASKVPAQRTPPKGVAHWEQGKWPEPAETTPVDAALDFPATTMASSSSMSETEPEAVIREAFNQEFVRALDDLVAAAKYHDAEIKASIARSDELTGRRRAHDAERARNAAVNPVVRETPPGYGNSADRLDRMDQRLERIDQRLERMDRTLTDINERMATKVELEATKDNITRMADGYQNIGQRLDAVANLLKPRVHFS
jgi:hypothetical protein